MPNATGEPAEARANGGPDLLQTHRAPSSLAQSHAHHPAPTETIGASGPPGTALPILLAGAARPGPVLGIGQNGGGWSWSTGGWGGWGADPGREVGHRRTQVGHLHRAATQQVAREPLQHHRHPPRIPAIPAGTRAGVCGEGVVGRRVVGLARCHSRRSPCFELVFEFYQVEGRLTRGNGLVLSFMPRLVRVSATSPSTPSNALHGSDEATACIVRTFCNRSHLT